MVASEEELAAASRAANVRSLGHPAKLAALLDPGWEARAHSDLISRSLADLADGSVRRLLVTTPPQIGKSVLLSEWFPFWWLARNPTHRIVVGSYGTSLANRRGRVVRKLVREHGWRYGMEMEPGAASVAEWSLTTGGGLKSVGVGSGVTGSPADCIAGGTLILTEHGEIPAARLARMRNPPRVAAWNHTGTRYEWRHLRAVRALRLHTLREIETEGRRSLWCSHDHPVYVIGRGYIHARHVNPGDEVIAAAERQPHVQQRSFNPFPATSGAPHQTPGRAAGGMGPGQSTRPATNPTGRQGEPATPERRRDWVRINRTLPSRSTKVVYDFQVEGLGNFVADGILTHNCAIIDDPHKSRAEAESLVTRDKVWDWWSADITSRLAPGAPIVLVLTLWHCLTYDQHVSTVNGSTPVQDIHAGDYVLTSNGYQQVQGTASRMHTGDSMRLRVFGTPEELHVTPDHRVWTEHGWAEAGDLSKGDWLLLPAPPRGPEMTDDELRSLVPKAETSTRTPPTRGTGERAPLTKEQFEQHLDDGRTYQQISNLHGRKTKGAAFEWARTLGVRNRTRGNEIDRECTLDTEFWRIVGLWLAEGTITYGTKGHPANVCRWSFGAGEERTHGAEVVKLLGKYGITAKCNMRGKGRANNFTEESQGTAVVTASSHQLATLLSTFGKGASNKHLPDWACRLPRGHALALLQGWAEGDGCPMVAHEGFTQVTSSSFRLLRDFQQLLVGHGYKANITGSNGKSHPQLRFKLEGNDSKDRIRTGEDGMWARVRYVEREHYTGPVYDLQTPTGDFVAGGVLVHNCDDLAARVLGQDGREEEGGMWRVLRMPALADSTDDPLGREWGGPLPHPKIPEGDQGAARDHWEMKRSTSMVRDWHALYQCDPKPNEGALVTPELLRARRHFPPPAAVQRFGVAVDPAGGGRDLAGVVGGYLGTDTRLYITHDASRNGHSEQWAMEAALMAAENEADFIILEQNYGGDMARVAVDSAWDAVARLHRGEAHDFDDTEHARRAQALPAMPHKPQIKLVVARKGKLLRAEPIAQQWYDDRMRTGKYLPELESEWTTHQTTDPESPGRIDASVYLAYEMLPVPGSEAMVSVVSNLNRDQVQQHAMRRPPAQPQMGTRIQRNPIRPR